MLTDAVDYKIAPKPTPGTQPPCDAGVLSHGALPDAAVSDADKLESVAQGLQRIENQLKVMQGLQVPRHAGFKFKEVIWNVRNPFQTFAKEAADGWMPLASDVGAYASGGQYTYTAYGNPRITFYKALTQEEVRTAYAAERQAAHEKAEKEFEARRQKAAHKGFFSRLKEKM